MQISDFEKIPSLPDVFGPANQVAYVVKDIDAAVQFWHDEFGVGPFAVFRNETPLSNATYRGNPMEETHLNIAFAYVGDIQLELIELIGDTPSHYKEALDRNQTGVHHYCVCVEDFPAAYEHAMSNDFVALVDAGVDGVARMSYVEDSNGMILEIVQWNALTRPFFDGIKELVESGDPSRLVHEHALAELFARAGGA